METKTLNELGNLQTDEVIVPDRLLITDLSTFKVGDFVYIEVKPDFHKKKYFYNRGGKNKTLIRKKCRIAGMARSDYYGLGFFIAPEGFTKTPFVCYIHEYGTTWTAFKGE